MALTVTSRVEPGREKVGSFAVTITAATFRERMSRGSTRTPKRPSTDETDCMVKSTCSESPVLVRPTTRP